MTKIIPLRSHSEKSTTKLQEIEKRLDVVSVVVLVALALVVILIGVLLIWLITLPSIG